jgi:acyl-CoA thioesterase-1
MVHSRLPKGKHNKYLSDNLSFFALCLGCIVCIAILGSSKPQDTINITAFGDSITEGLYSGSGGYPPRLNLLFSNNGTPSVVINTGISGEKTPEGAARFSEVLTNFPSKFVLIMEGTNDVLHGLSVETTRENLQKMIDIAKTRGVIPILATLPPSTQSDMGTLIPKVWNPMIMSLAKSNGIKIADHYSAISPTWASSTIDGIHPNDIGHTTIAETWYLAIREMIFSRGETSLKSILTYQAKGFDRAAPPAFIAPLENHLGKLIEFRDSILLALPPVQLLVNTYNHYLSTLADYLTQHKEDRPVVITLLYLARIFLYPLAALSYLILLLGLPLQVALFSVLTAGMFFTNLCMNIFIQKQQAQVPSQNSL